MADSDKKISAFASGTVDQSSYFLQANNGASSKVSAEDIGDFVNTSQTYSGLNTTAKSPIGAINELMANKLSFVNNAGLHNSIYRGKSLGSEVTDEQYMAISAGTFDDMFIGDYWTIYDSTLDKNIDYRIAAFDYYYERQSGSNVTVNNHHITLVPDQIIGQGVILAQASDWTNGYYNSAMYTTNLPAVKPIITNAFGSSHIQNVPRNSTETVMEDIFLMTAFNLFGSTLGYIKSQNDIGYDGTIYPLFSLEPQFTRSDSIFVYTRTLPSGMAYDQYAIGTSRGQIAAITATQSRGIRPAFNIKA